VERLRTRRQTRASILAALLAPGGMFRPRLAEACELTEASISRICAELREEGLIEEIRGPAPYPGGPSHRVILHRGLRIAGLEVAQEHLTIGVGRPDGTLLFHERLALPMGASARRVRAVLGRGVGRLAGWCAEAGAVPCEIGVSIPGFRGLDGPRNPILPLDAAWLERALGVAFGDVPVATANSIVARAALHLQGAESAPGGPRRLFVHLGHGVGGAWLEPIGADAPIRAIEIGHVVLDRNGPACRCGHLGCLEASASTTALAALCGIEEPALLAAGGDWPSHVAMTPAREQAIGAVLEGVGLVIGNALNLLPAAEVVLSGWPAPLPPALRAAVARGMDRSLFGGLRRSQPALRFLSAAPHAGPAAAIAFALHSLLRRGGLPAAAVAPRRLAG
jgi:predicted NBD/HSP70 family sugar kinase